MLFFIIYFLVGCFTGILSGLFGIGGGVIVVPALLYVFSHEPFFVNKLIMNLATGTSLAIMSFTAQSSVIAHVKLGGHFFSFFKYLWLAIVIGTITGGILAKAMPNTLLELLLGFFLLIVSIHMFFKPVETLRGSRVIAPWWHRCVGFLVGLMSGLLGIGGGTLMIPYLNYCGIEVRKIISLSALCTLIIALTGTMTFIVIGYNKSGLPRYTLGYIYLPAVLLIAIPSSILAPVGAKLSYILTAKQLRYGLIGLLLTMSILILTLN